MNNTKIIVEAVLKEAMPPVGTYFRAREVMHNKNLKPEEKIDVELARLIGRQIYHEQGSEMDEAPRQKFEKWLTEKLIDYGFEQKTITNAVRRVRQASK